VWVDVEDIRPSDDWLRAIHAAIDGADAFVFVVSPDSVDPSSVCTQEIEYAVTHNKRIIPIVCREVDTRLIRVPESIGKINWVSFLASDGFEQSIVTLVSAIETDLDWVKQHTRLLERAVEWNGAKRDASFLLQKNDLKAAERWLAHGPTKDPKPTALQTEYVIDSRSSATRRQRMALGALASGLVLTIALAILAWFQRNEAVSQANIALARQMAAQAGLIRNERPDLLGRSALLALESLKRYPTLEADQILRQAMPLLPQAVSRPITHDGAVTAGAFDPTGRRLATASADGSVGVWETTTGQQVFAIKPVHPAQDVRFSPDGTSIATADTSGTVQVWSATDGLPIGPAIEHPPGPVNSLAFSANGRYLAVVSDQGADIWQGDSTPDSRQKVFSTSAGDPAFPCMPLSAFVFSATGQHAAAACRGRARVWETSGWTPVLTIPYTIRSGLRPPLHPIAFSADDRLFASADEVYDLETGSLRYSVHSQHPVTAVAFGHAGAYLALAAGESVRVVNTLDGVQFAEVHHAKEVLGIAFSPDGEQLATSGNDNTARIWHLSRYAGEGPTEEIARLSPGSTPSFVAFSADGRYLATGTEDGVARVWQVGDPRELFGAVYGGVNESVASICSGGSVLAVADGTTMQVWDASSGRGSGHMSSNDPSDRTSQFSTVRCGPSGRYFSAIVARPQSRGVHGEPLDTSKTARLWDMSRSAPVGTLAFEDADGMAAFSPDGKYFATPDRATLGLWDLTAGREVARIAHEPLRVPPIFSGDGRHLAIVEETAARVFDTAGLHEILRIASSKAAFRVAAFSPSGRTIALGSDETVNLWSVAGPQTTAVLPVKYATAILFTPDGKRIVTANWNFHDAADQSVRIWEVDGLREIDRLPLLAVQASVSASETHLAFTGDGRYLAIANQGMFRIWDMVTRQEVARREGGYASTLAFSPDGKLLLAGNGTIVSSWSWEVPATIAAACKRLSRNLDAAEWRLYVGEQPYRKTCPER